MDRKELLNALKIITNLILIISLVATLYALVNYNEELKEVLNDSNPERLLTYYENRSGLTCYCNTPYEFKKFIPLEPELYS